MIYLISCVAKKQASPALAKDLYISQLFLKARAFVEAKRCPWFILSAEHGLLDPNQVIDPYEKTLNTMGVHERRRWAARVVQQLGSAGITDGTVVVLAGQRYREFVAPALRDLGVKVEVPMRGLRIGEQLRWLGRTADDSGRVGDLKRFYALLGELEQRLGGCRRLSECDGRMGWPGRGVYFFFEAGQARTHSGTGPRLVRVGTHALTATSRTTLWNRLSQHRGTSSGSGNHRGSIFRLLVGQALITQAGKGARTWGVGASMGAAAAKVGSTPDEVKATERLLEQEVSARIGAMPFLWLAVDDSPSSAQMRGFIERNAIALLGNHQGGIADPASGQWLGQHSNREKVRDSGLWNQNHVDENYDPEFLDVFARYIRQIEAIDEEGDQ